MVDASVHKASSEKKTVTALKKERDDILENSKKLAMDYYDPSAHMQKGEWDYQRSMAEYESEVQRMADDLVDNIWSEADFFHYLKRFSDPNIESKAKEFFDYKNKIGDMNVNSELKQKAWELSSLLNEKKTVTALRQERDEILGLLDETRDA
jgi:hypothetical protein